MKTALKLTIILALLFSIVGLFFVVLSKANPINLIRPPTGTIPPKITILNPQNHTAYSSGNLNITIHATKAATSSPTTFLSFGVSLFLDGVLLDSISEIIPRSELDISTVLHDPLIGKHKLEAKASYVFYVRFGGVFSSDSTSTVFFTVENAQTSPSPSPSPEFTPTPEPTIEPESLPTSLAIASSIPVAVVLVGLGLLLISIKRK